MAQFRAKAHRGIDHPEPVLRSRDLMFIESSRKPSWLTAALTGIVNQKGKVSLVVGIRVAGFLAPAARDHVGNVL